MTLRHRARASLIGLTLFNVAVPLLGPATLRGQDEPPAERRPMLEQLDRETRALYRDAVGGLVRVQLPAPHWANPIAQRHDLLKRWPNLSPDVRRQLEQHARAARQAPPPAAATQPGGGGAGDGGDPGEILVVPPPAPAHDPQREAMVGGRLEMGPPTDGSFAPNNVGLLLDDAGHLLVPLHIEPDAASKAEIRAAGPDGVVRAATFVGSDRQTNLTVLKLRIPTEGEGPPPLKASVVRLSRERPADGALVLYVAPHDGSARLGVWTGAATDFGIVFTIDGEAAGITRYGQFLNGPACRLIADQIIRHGKVRRATLGVIISEIRQDDPLRGRVPVLGNRTAMLINQVIPGSPAEQAGLRAGDLLLSLAGEAVGDVPSLAAAIATRSGRTELQVLRDGKVREVVVELKQE